MSPEKLARLAALLQKALQTEHYHDRESEGEACEACNLAHDVLTHVPGLLDAAGELEWFSEALSEAGRESWDMMEDFSMALNLPEQIEPADPPMRPGYPHILAAIAQLNTERDALRARVERMAQAINWIAGIWVNDGHPHDSWLERAIDAAREACR